MIKPRAVEINQPASQQELDLIFALRRQVFVQEQGFSIADEYDEHEATAHHFGGTFGGQLVACGRWRHTEKGAKLERIAVDPAHRNKGLGAQMVKAMLADVVATSPGTPVAYLNSQLPALPFYERLGFRPVGELFDEAGAPHQQMELSL